MSHRVSIRLREIVLIRSSMLSASIKLSSPTKLGGIVNVSNASSSAFIVKGSIERFDLRPVKLPLGDQLLV